LPERAEDPRFKELANRVSTIDPDHLTPVAALLELAELRTFAEKLLRS
jgi:hypothetical protein